MSRTGHKIFPWFFSYLYLCVFVIKENAAELNFGIKLIKIKYFGTGVGERDTFEHCFDNLISFIPTCVSFAFTIFVMLHAPL